MLHDVIVIGAGPGGATTAHFLAQAGLDVLLLDKFDFPRDKTCGDGLTPRALRMLARLDVLEAARQAGCEMQQATVFAPNGTPITTQMPAHAELPDYMLALPRHTLDHLLWQRALESGASFVSPVRVTAVAPAADRVTVTGKRGKRPFQAQGRLVVLAVGANVRLLLKLGLLEDVPPMILAARAYFEQIDALSGHFEFHFDGVPLPGYGWVFPLSADSANIGAGFWPVRRWWQPPATETAKGAMARFLQAPHMAALLHGAQQVGPVKGFPLRTDFATAPTTAARMLLVGETAGLVNPLTGEGVDYAMESGELAAAHIVQMFAQGDFSQARLAQYDAALRTKFQRLFLFSNRIRNWYLNRPVINQLVHAARRQDALRALFTDIVLGNEDAAAGLSLPTMWKIVTA